jgi:hypothetical protein
LAYAQQEIASTTRPDNAPWSIFRFLQRVVAHSIKEKKDILAVNNHSLIEQGRI